MNGRKPIPLPLKVLSGFLVLWTLMSAGALVAAPDREIAFFGALLTGVRGAVIILLLDVVSPLVFLFALFKRLPWGSAFGMGYNGVFIANIVVALFLFRDVFGGAMIPPLVASLAFFAIIYKERAYFRGA